jgi:hypothetical protein
MCLSMIATVGAFEGGGEVGGAEARTPRQVGLAEGPGERLPKLQLRRGVRDL